MSETRKVRASFKFASIMKLSLSVLYSEPGSELLKVWYRYSRELTSMSLLMPLISLSRERLNLKPVSSPTWTLSLTSDLLRNLCTYSKKLSFLKDEDNVSYLFLLFLILLNEEGVEDEELLSLELSEGVNVIWIRYCEESFES